MKNIQNERKLKSVNSFPSVLIAVTFMCIAFNSSGQNVDDLKLKDYRPVSIYNVPVSHIIKAKYPAIDMHTHVYAQTDQDIQQWIKEMDDCGIQKTIILTGAVGAKFDTIVKMYSKYRNRFELWCGFDYTGYDKPAYGFDAVKELERCLKKGAYGVGEIMFKGKGFTPTSSGRTMMLPDDQQMDILFEKCAELGMPVNLHVSEDKWMYEKIDSTNDGLMNAAKWHIPIGNGNKSHEEMLDRLGNTLKKHPKTTFVAAHLANCCADLSVLGNLFDNYPNLFADISARYGEIAPIPQFVHNFIETYQDRLVYGTDVNFNEMFYRATFRILESADEHFYETGMFGYHWPLYGLALSDKALKKLYKGNALKIMNR